MAKYKSLLDLVSVRTLEKIQENFSEATGMASAIRDINGKQLTKTSNPSRLWEAVSKTPVINKQAAKRMIDSLNKCKKSNSVEIVNRYFDTYAYIVPIYAQGRISAYFIGGLTRYGNPDMNMCIAEANKLNIDIDTFLEMYLELPIVTENKLLACANLFKIIATTISSFSKEKVDIKEKVTEIAEKNITLEKEFRELSVEKDKNEELYKKLFNTINDGVYMSDNEGYIIDINNAGAKILGYNKKDLIGKKIKQFYINPSDRDIFISTIYKYGHIEYFHPVIKYKDRTKVLETNATLIKGQNGKIIGIQGIFRELNERSRHSSLYKKQNATKANITSTKNYKSTLKTS